MENNIYDLAILGAGPAGICAAIYATRAKLNTIWLDRKFVQGGQIVDTYEVDNYPGLPGITGLDLGEAMAGHAEKLGLKPKREPVLSVTDEGEIKGDEPEVPFEEHDGYFIYDGITYNTVTLSNGTTWMAEPLRYVPDGYTPSSDPAADSHIWYPYELVTVDGTLTAKALQDATSIKQYGYLYDIHAALSGKAVTPENCYDFEGAQGICPKGWHIPTRAEYFSLVGNSTKDADGNSLENGKDALFYDTAYDGGKIPTLNEAKFNYQFSGVRMSTGYSAVPKYQATAITSSNSTVTEWFGKPSMSYYMTSTAYKPIYSTSTGDLTNIQFFGLMSTFSMAKYPEGRLSLSYISVLSGQTVRCVKNQN